MSLAEGKSGMTAMWACPLIGPDISKVPFIVPEEAMNMVPWAPVLPRPI